MMEMLREKLRWPTLLEFLGLVFAGVLIVMAGQVWIFLQWMDPVALNEFLVKQVTIEVVRFPFYYLIAGFFVWFFEALKDEIVMYGEGEQKKG